MTKARAGRGKVHGPDGRFISTPESAERDAEATRLRGRALSYQAIADEMGWANISSAYRAVQRGLAAIRSEPAEEVRTLELERLDDLYRRTLGVLEGRHLVISNGRIVFDPDLSTPDVPVPLKDNAVALQAVDRLLKIQERRARLLGLDAPSRLSVDAQSLGSEIVELLGLAGGDGGGDGHDG